MGIQKTEHSGALPESASNYGFNLFCVVFFFAAMFFLHARFPRMEAVYLTMICLMAAIIPLWLYDFCCVHVHKRPSTGLLARPGAIDKERLTIKLVGLYGTFIIILLYYHFIVHFFAVAYLKTFLHFLALASPWIIILCYIYFREVDRRQKDPYDEYWHMGCFLTGRFKKINPVILKEYACVWLIKGFFTPYLVVILVHYVERLLAFNWDNRSFFLLYNYLLDLFYAADVIYAALGYIMTCRLLDTHIRSTEPTLLGWLVCLICYGVFHSHFGLGLLQYDDGLNWNHWFAFSPFFYYFYGLSILFLSCVYCLATVSFGYRTSNLTYRGIITSGPYRFTKHPAYLCKVASWWLISLPFFSVESPFMALKHTAVLGFITFIYYLRALTEENHLSNYPEYVQYARWINEHGLFSFITKHFPSLQYSEEKCKRWGSVVWFKKI